MSKISIPKDILQKLDRVVESKANKEKLTQEASAANHEYRKLLNDVGKFIEAQASQSDEIAEQFFTEEGILYKGQLFAFDDEGAFIVCIGPQVIEVEA